MPSSLARGEYGKLKPKKRTSHMIFMCSKMKRVFVPLLHLQRIAFRDEASALPSLFLFIILAFPVEGGNISDLSKNKIIDQGQHK